MKTINSLLALSVILTLLVYVGCSNDPISPTPEKNQISGKITFVDTNFVLSGASYIVAAFASWPPTGGPNAYDTLSISTSKTIYDYTLKGVSTGDYVVAVGFRKLGSYQTPIMSVYGCDTASLQSSNCAMNPPLRATIGSNGESSSGIDMISWADTTNKIF